MLGIAWSVSSRKQLFAIVSISMIFLSGCLGTGEGNQEQDSQNGEITLSVWHTFAAESKEEQVFMNSILSLIHI